MAFDLDGTLLRGRTVCQLLAVPCGRVSDTAAFERSATEAEVEAGRVAMVAWYQGVPRETLLGALEAAEWAPGAASAVVELRRRGIEVIIASITWSFAVEWFAARLGITRCLGTELLAGGQVRHAWPRHKGAWVKQQAEDLGVPGHRIAAVGDSAGDTELLGAAAVRVFVGTTVPAPLTGVHHLPGSGLDEVAALILDAWA
ncbi:MAG TPA: haloacid dehalogenase-like hydrolase [Vicinamibacteria bacterium]